ncbi:MAG: hypothetical protein L6Q99_04080 [Planctomycetes bacterium]|nr:hypothetical protein [Planctomycetota bacterium]
MKYAFVLALGFAALLTFSPSASAAGVHKPGWGDTPVIVRPVARSHAKEASVAKPARPALPIGKPGWGRN